MWRETYKAKSFYDFDYTLLRWQFDPLSHLDRKERWVDVPVKLGDEHHVVRVQGYGTTADPSFEVIGDSGEAKEQLLTHIEGLFQWDKDLEKVHEHFLTTNLEHLFLAHPGTPIVKDFHLFDCLMKVIIHQQLNMKFAHTLSTRFVHQFGKEKDGVWFYPNAYEVAQIPYEALRELQFSQRKAEYVVDTSRMIVDGELDLEDLAKQTDEEVMKKLTKVRGIGPWTAENWLMFGVGREDLLPKADIGIQNALKFYFQLKDKPDKGQMTDWSQNWEPYRSYASLTLWRSIEG
ncbi:DNA-3-methyladenine glycosylase [Halobacillus sp. BBL2006]|uniref:DNA-3-methyladenine glycosylase family protein n=1 Tax=Halobacillus sp. BBL2006 TaxID=1543706 RepID=UPI000542F2A3|nr:DNA-3-methyladenine glycosylase [Halobacillus sp. BBL2006]KHE71025.1 DNA-3-methyladenine glycosylase [Halobacillus sp. BBL2006]